MVDNLWVEHTIFFMHLETLCWNRVYGEELVKVCAAALEWARTSRQRVEIAVVNYYR